MLRVTGRGPLEMGTWTHQGDKHVGSGVTAVTPTSPWWAVEHGAWVLLRGVWETLDGSRRGFLFGLPGPLCCTGTRAARGPRVWAELLS